MYSLRLAKASDVKEICSFDMIAQTDERRSKFILRSVLEGNCFVVTSEQILGYGVLEYTFYDNGFVSILVVRSASRRRGVGTALLKYFESVCQTAKLFTSTNLSNLPMQSLLLKLEYKLCGVIHELDIGDPELIYVKHLLADNRTRASTKSYEALYAAKGAT